MTLFERAAAEKLPWNAPRSGLDHTPWQWLRVRAHCSSSRRVIFRSQPCFNKPQIALPPDGTIKTPRLMKSLDRNLESLLDDDVPGIMDLASLQLRWNSSVEYSSDTVDRRWWRGKRLPSLSWSWWLREQGKKCIWVYSSSDDRKRLTYINSLERLKGRWICF